MDGATVCKSAIKAKKIIKDYVVNTTEKLSDMTGLNAAKIVEDFANVYSKADDASKNEMEKVYGFKKSATEDIDEVISMITNGSIKSMNMLRKSTDPFIANGVLNNISALTQSMIRMSGNQKELYDAARVNEYRGIVKGAQWANAMGMGTQKFLSGWAFQSMLGDVAEEFDGVFINKDFIMKQNLGVDSARGDYVNAYKRIETDTPNLHKGMLKIISNHKALAGGLTVEAINKLMKNFDKDLNEDGKNTSLKDNIKTMIDEGKLKLGELDKSEGDAILRYSALMDGVYSEWKRFNYGTEDTSGRFFEDYYKNWDKYRGSYLTHIIAGGVDYVKTIHSGLKSKQISSEMLINLSPQEREILNLFSKYAFKGDEVLEKEFTSLTRSGGESGIDVNAGMFRPRQDYVPYLMNDSIKGLFEASSANSTIPFADMLSSRSERFDSNSEVDVVKNFTTDVESYRAMMTKAHEMLFARRINDKILNDPDGTWKSWKSSHAFEAAVIQKYAKQIMTRADETAETRSNKTVELFRQTMLALLGLQNAVTLMGSGPKNLLQGISTLMMNKDAQSVFDMWSGKLSIKKAKDSNVSIGETTESDMANRVDVLLNNMISGRRAEVKLYDAQGEGLEGKYADMLQYVFSFVEKSNQYGMLAPLKALFPTKFDAMDSMVETDIGKIFTNAGSESSLRNFRKHEAFSMIGFEFHADKMILEGDATKETKDAIMHKWSKNNLDDTIRSITDKYKYDLYEKDNRYFGDFGTDTKPFWTHTMLHDGDTIVKVMLGYIAANWYMFRQAGNFGLMTGLMSTAKSMGEGIGSKSATINAPIAMPAIVLGALLVDNYTTFFNNDNQMNIPLVSAMNQMQDLGVGTKAIALFTAPLFNFNMSKESHDKIIEAMSRWGGGMVGGKTLQSIFEDIDNDLAPLTTMFQTQKNYIPHLTRGIYGLVSSYSSAEFKEAKDNIASAYQFTFPGLDNIVGGNNDVLRMFVDMLAAGGSVYNSAFASEDDAKKYSEYRNRSVNKLIASISGTNILEIRSGMKMFEKKVADVTDEDFLRAFAIEESVNPGTHDVDDLKDATNDLYRGME